MRSACALRRVTTMGPAVSRAAAAAAATARKAPLLSSIAHHQQRRRSVVSVVVAASASSSPSSTPASSTDPFARFAEAQAALPRPSLAEEARTLLAAAKTGVLSTSSSAGGHPLGSVVQFALPSEAASSSSPCSPILALSSLSAHTRDLAADPRCSLTVLSPGFAGMEDGRVSLTCVAKKLENGGEEQTAARACYRSKHPDAFWSDFGDFSWWRLDLVGEEKPNLPAARVVMGFGRAGSLTSTQLSTASPDPVSAFSAPVAGHMNADHGDAVLAVARSATGLGERVVKAAMGRVDRLGFEVELVLASEENGEYENEKKESKRPLSKDAAAGERLRARVAFPQPAEDRKALKDRLVEMTKAAKGASG